MNRYTFLDALDALSPLPAHLVGLLSGGTTVCHAPFEALLPRTRDRWTAMCCWRAVGAREMSEGSARDAHRVCFFAAAPGREDLTQTPLTLWLSRAADTGAHSLIAQFGDRLFCVDHAQIRAIGGSDGVLGGGDNGDAAEDNDEDEDDDDDDERRGEQSVNRSVRAEQSVMAEAEGDEAESSASTTDLPPPSTAKRRRGGAVASASSVTPLSSGASIEPGQADVSSFAERQRRERRRGRERTRRRQRSPPFIELGFSGVALRIWLVAAAQAMPPPPAARSSSGGAAGGAGVNAGVGDQSAEMAAELRGAVERMRGVLDPAQRSLFLAADRDPGPPPLSEEEGSSAAAATVATAAAAAATAPVTTAAAAAAVTATARDAGALHAALSAVDAGQQRWDDVAAAAQRLAHVCDRVGGGDGAGRTQALATLANELGAAYARTLRPPRVAAAAAATIAMPTDGSGDVRGVRGPAAMVVSRDPKERAALQSALEQGRAATQRSVDAWFGASKRNESRAAKRRRSSSSSGGAGGGGVEVAACRGDELKQLHARVGELSALTAAQIWLASAAPPRTSL